MKKVSFMVMVVLLLGVFSLTACNNDTLDAYKNAGKTAIETYAQERKGNYSEDNWTVVCGIVEAGKTAVDEAKSKSTVDTAVATAKTEIDEVAKEDLKTQAKQTYLETVLKPKHPEATIDDVSFRPFLGIYNESLVAVFYGGQFHGNFPDVEDSYELSGLTFAFSRGYPILVWSDGNIFELPEAYEQGLLTKANLIAIHNIYYGLEEDDMVIQVKQTYVDEFLKTEHPEATTEDVIITKYLGTYGGSFVAVLNDIYNKFFIEEEIELVIDGLNFSYSYGYPIRVWNSGKIYDLAVAYEQEFLTKEDLQEVANIYQNKA